MRTANVSPSTSPQKPRSGRTGVNTIGINRPIARPWPTVAPPHRSCSAAAASAALVAGPRLAATHEHGTPSVLSNVLSAALRRCCGHQIVCRDQLQLGLPQVLVLAAAALKTRRLLVLRCACARVRWQLAVGRGCSATTRHWPSIAALPAPSVLVANSAKIIARHPNCAGHGRAAGCGPSKARRRWRLPLQVAFLDVDPRAGCATLEHQGYSRRALPRRMVLQLCEWLFGAADALEAPYPRGRGGTVQATLTPPRPPPQNQTHRTCPFP